ncbi:thioredoxin, partial [Pontibaca methylaminivorans]|uniref:thioredoxin n=1 Tax=Pontibaca methylaminivorans TaxID=515897 RepID=UPI002FD9AB4A
MFELSPQGGAAAGDPVMDGTEAGFMADVIEVSNETPVIVDFWAPWCGPCKTLGPMLEEAVRAAKGAVRMVKINVDEAQMLAGQLQIQSIPTVYAFHKGRPIDAFQGALPQSEIKAFIDRVIAAGGGGSAQGDPLTEAIAAAEEMLEEG